MGSCESRDEDTDELERLREDNAKFKRQLAAFEPSDKRRSLLASNGGACNDGTTEKPTNFTDGDGVPEFLNQLLEFLWPHISNHVSEIIKSTVEPAVKKALPANLASILEFDRAHCNLGDVPIQFPFLGAHKSNQITEGGQVTNLLLKAAVEWKGNISVLLRLAKVGLGVRTLTLEGQLIIEFVGLIDRPPFYEGMRIYFVNVPIIDLGFSGALAGLNAGLIKRKILGVIEAQISSRLVVPNRIAFTQTPEADIFRIKNPRPQGMLKFTVQRAEDLLAMDTVVFGKNSSDPFVEIVIGADSFKSPTVQKCLTPTFDFTVTLPIFHFSTQMLHLKLFDEDTIGENDFLGMMGFCIADMIGWGEESIEVTLQDKKGRAGKNGKVFLKAEWRPLLLDLKVKQDKMGYVFAGVYDASQVKAGKEGTKYWVEATHKDLGEPQVKQSLKCLPSIETQSSEKKEEEAEEMGRKLQIMRKFGVSTEDMAQVLEVDLESLSAHESERSMPNDGTQSTRSTVFYDHLVKVARHKVNFTHAFEFHTNNAESSSLTLELKEQGPDPDSPEKSLGSTQISFDHNSETKVSTIKLESGACLKVRTQLRFLAPPSTQLPYSEE